MNLGLDLDGTITENPHLFSILSHSWPANVYIITYRNDLAKTKAELNEFGIFFNEVILVKSLSEKAKHIQELNISVYFDDQDEVLNTIPESVTVLKLRNGGNYSNGLWLYSNQTGRLV